MNQSELNIRVVKDGASYPVSFEGMIQRDGHNLVLVCMKSGILEVVDQCYIKPLNK